MSTSEYPKGRPRQERSDINSKAVLIGAAAVVVALLAVALIARAVVSYTGPERIGAAERGPTAPTLLSSPGADQVAYQREKRMRLESYGWVDPDRGIARVPIERAMQMLAEPEKPEAQP